MKEREGTLCRNNKRIIKKKKEISKNEGEGRNRSQGFTKSN